MRSLVERPWLGNIRELQQILRRLVYRCEDGGVIDSSMLEIPQERVADGQSDELSFSLELKAHRRALEIRLIREALGRAQGLQTRAAKQLGISRNSLADKIKRYGLDTEDFRPD